MKYHSIVVTIFILLHRFNTTKLSFVGVKQCSRPNLVRVNSVKSKRVNNFTQYRKQLQLFARKRFKRRSPASPFKFHTTLTFNRQCLHYPYGDPVNPSVSIRIEAQ